MGPRHFGDYILERVLVRSDYLRLDYWQMKIPSTGPQAPSHC